MAGVPASSVMRLTARALSAYADLGIRRVEPQELS